VKELEKSMSRLSKENYSPPEGSENGDLKRKRGGDSLFQTGAGPEGTTPVLVRGGPRRGDDTGGNQRV